MFHGFYSRDNFAARFLQSSTSFPLWTMPIFLLLSEAIAGCHFPDWKFLANCKDRAQEGWVRSHTACSKVWSYSRNCLQSDTPSFFCFGDCLILATQHLVLSVDSDRKEKKRWKSSQKNFGGFWFVSSFQHNFLLWHWELGFSKASNFSAHVSLLQINLWKRGCRGLCETCWHSWISLFLKRFGFLNLNRAEIIHSARMLDH